VKWIEYLFPYRTHLEREVEYLRAQVAQQRRRLDEIEGGMLELMRGLGRKEPRREPAKPIAIKARGWEAYKAQQRTNGNTEDAVDAGSEDQTSGVGS
jgi:hypothetical protein